MEKWDKSKWGDFDITTMKRNFIIIGMDDNREPFFPPEVLQHIHGGKIFSGGLRHREIVEKLLPEGAEWISITVPLDDVFDQYERIFAATALNNFDAASSAPIIVFASGDPLFFGFANTIKRKLPDAGICLYPAFNSLQTLAHRLVMPYDDMRTVSLTGRPWQELDRALIERTQKIGVLTDREHTPATIAARMLEYGYTYYIMYVGEHLGHPERERIRQLSLAEASTETFEYPNNLFLCYDTHNSSVTAPVYGQIRHPYTVGYDTRISKPRPFGLPDEDFAHLDGRARMITKAPIRLLTLQALELPRRCVFWDIGFCTGSISIEARLQFPHLTVVAFEIRPEGEALMHTNSRRFGAPGIQTRIGDFLQEDLAPLPRPDAVFIGGHGGRLKEILARLKTVLHPDGCIVFNSVSDASRALFIEGAQSVGLALQPSLRIALNDYNPIEIMKATL